MSVKQQRQSTSSIQRVRRGSLRQRNLRHTLNLATCTFMGGQMDVLGKKSSYLNEAGWKPLERSRVTVCRHRSGRGLIRVRRYTSVNPVDLFVLPLIVSLTAALADPIVIGLRSGFRTSLIRILPRYRGIKLDNHPALMSSGGCGSYVQNRRANRLVRPNFPYNCVRGSADCWIVQLCESAWGG